MSWELSRIRLELIALSSCNHAGVPADTDLFRCAVVGFARSARRGMAGGGKRQNMTLISIRTIVERTGRSRKLAGPASRAGFVAGPPAYARIAQMGRSRVPRFGTGPSLHGCTQGKGDRPLLRAAPCGPFRQEGADHRSIAVPDCRKRRFGTAGGSLARTACRRRSSSQVAAGFGGKPWHTCMGLAAGTHPAP